MRGKGTFIEKNPALVRITPAYAGKSGSENATNPAYKDHPRLCGEKGIE